MSDAERTGGTLYLWSFRNLSGGPRSRVGAGRDGKATSDVRGLVGVRDAGGAHPRPRNRAMGRQIDASSERFLTVMDREG